MEILRSKKKHVFFLTSDKEGPIAPLVGGLQPTNYPFYIAIYRCFNSIYNDWLEAHLVGWSMIQRVEVESLASVVAEKLPKLPVAAEAGGLDVAGEAFLGEKRGGGAVLEVQDLAEVEVEGSNLYIWEVIWGTGKGKLPFREQVHIPEQKENHHFQKCLGSGYGLVPWRVTLIPWM